MALGAAARLGTAAPRPVRWLRVVLISAVLAGGLAAAVVSWHQETRRVADAADADLDRASALVTALGNSIDTSLAGAAAVVAPDGALDRAAFEAFAGELLSPGGLRALAFAPVVPGSDRAAFEAQLGRPITDRPEGGEPAPAAGRDEYYPVEHVVSIVPGISEQLLGFDLAGDPVRATVTRQARDAGSTVFSGPVPSQPSGARSVFLAKPIYQLGSRPATAEDRRRLLVGFVATSLAAETIGEAMALVLPPAVPFEVRDQGELLVAGGEGDVAGGDQRMVAAADREWTVVVDGGGDADRAVPLLLGLLTLVVVAAMVYDLRRSGRVDEAKERDARRSEELARLAEGLAMLTTTEDVMRFLSTGVLAPLDACHAAVAVIEGNRLRRYFTPGRMTEEAARLLPDTVPLHADMPLARAARTGDPVLLDGEDALAEHYPALVDGWRALGFVATANLPLRDRNGHLIGALGLAWDHRVDFDAMRDTMATVAGIAGQTIDRARLSDAEHRLVTDLQAAVLTPLPATPGLEVAERYLPAIDDVGMGGDWYQGIALGNGRYLVVVGDVAGHGIAAVAKMAQLRSTIGTIASLGTPLADVLPRTATRPPGAEVVVATAALVEIDAGAGLVRYACAGHPPPLLRLPAGEVVQLDDGRQPLLGVAMEPRPAAEHPFPVGSVLVCYTDGLVERRQEGIDESIERLVGALAQSRATTADALADDLLARCLAGTQDDDVALAVVVHRGVTVS